MLRQQALAQVLAREKSAPHDKPRIRGNCQGCREKVLRKANPLDVLFVLSNDVDGHEDVQGIVDAPSDVLLFARWGEGVGEAVPRQLLDQLIGDLQRRVCAGAADE